MALRDRRRARRSPQDPRHRGKHGRCCRSASTRPREEIDHQVDRFADDPIPPEDALANRVNILRARRMVQIERRGVRRHRLRRNRALQAPRDGFNRHGFTPDPVEAAVGGGVNEPGRRSARFCRAPAASSERGTWFALFASGRTRNARSGWRRSARDCRRGGLSEGVGCSGCRARARWRVRLSRFCRVEPDRAGADADGHRRRRDRPRRASGPRRAARRLLVHRGFLAGHPADQPSRRAGRHLHLHRRWVSASTASTGRARPCSCSRSRSGSASPAP